MTDPLALVVSYIYVVLVIAAGEGLRRFAGYSPDFTRKFIHVGVGMWAVGTVLLFQRWQWAVIPPLTFVLVNYVSYRRQAIAAMDAVEGETLGTVYFPISFAVLIPLLWNTRVLFVAALMPMTWGDAFASILGQRFGRHRYTVFGHTKSWEGSLAMFAFSFVAVGAALAGFGESGGPAVAAAVATAVAATLAEAISPWGIDNLLVPLASAAVLVWMS